MVDENDVFDVIVIGAGPAGQTAAARAAREAFAAHQRRRVSRRSS